MKFSWTVLTVFIIGLIACSPSSESRSRLGDSDDSTSQLEQERVQERLSRATDVFRNLLTGPDGGLPERLLNSSTCIAVLPDVLKAAFIAGGRYGKGVVTCRTDSGQWASPAFVTLSGGSVGWQIGAESGDLVLFFTGPDAKSAVSQASNITLGADISVAAGPVGRKAEGKTDFTRTGIYSYAAASGLFAGISLEGAMISSDRRANEALYGEPFTTSAVISGIAAPATANKDVKQFLSVLPVRE